MIAETLIARDEKINGFRWKGSAGLLPCIESMTSREIMRHKPASVISELCSELGADEDCGEACHALDRLMMHRIRVRLAKAVQS